MGQWTSVVGYVMNLIEGSIFRCILETFSCVFLLGLNTFELSKITS